jgi:hypothetical protein
MSAPTKIKSQRSESANSPREVRAAYIYFHEKRTKNAAGVLFVFGANHPKAGQPNPRYSGAVMFPKMAADAAQCPNYAFLWGLACEAARKMWPQSVDHAGNWTWPNGARFPVQDGDIPYVPKPKPGVVPKTPEQIAAANAWRRGYWIIEPENFLDPGPQIAKVINGVETPLRAQNANGVAQYKSGDWGVINMHAYAYQNDSFGIGWGFDGFCFTREGEAIGSSGPRPVEQMFAGVAAMVPQGGQGVPPLPPSAAPPLAPAAPTAPHAVAPATAPMPTASAVPPSNPPLPPMPPMPSAAGAPPLPIPGR